MCPVSSQQCGHVVKIIKEAAIFLSKVAEAKRILAGLTDGVRTFFASGIAVFLRDGLHDMVQDIVEQASTVAKQKVSDKYKAWKDLADRSFLRGASAAHRFTKVQQAPEKLKPMVYGSPHALADREMVTWRE
eukprot:3088855-Pyramimonas_sp.AAC.1